ncbi:MAG: DUF99 family protein [Thermoanaerobaculia bacterium]|nr:DUF99 family protein [Thermoanaerobaculia bacterium]
MSEIRLSNVIGFDDGPFDRDSVSSVAVVGAVYAGTRFDGALVGAVAKDGDDATERLAELIERSRFRDHLQLVMMEGIALGGFNVVDIHELSERLELPVLVLCRRQPDLGAIRSALLSRVPTGDSKWRRIEAAGPMEPVGNVWLQRAGLSREAAAAVVERFAVHGHMPEPVRVAHLLARAFVTGESRGRV